MAAPCVRKLIVAPLLLVALAAVDPARAQGFGGGVRQALGDQFDVPSALEPPVLGSSRPRNTPAERLLYWNEIAINASGIDHTPVAVGESRTFGEQIGPGRASRAMAMVHIAMFDAVNAIATVTVSGALRSRFKSYTGLTPALGGTANNSLDAAIAQAAHDTLIVLYPSQRASIDALFAEDLQRIIEDGTPAANLAAGLGVGAEAARKILANRQNDGSDHDEPPIGNPNNRPGNWQQDPISKGPLALGERWGGVALFTIIPADLPLFRVPPPPGLKTPAYRAAFDEVKRLGGDGSTTPTERTPLQTETGIYWAYDGTPSLCAPPRLYNQITTTIAGLRATTDTVDLARLLALVNTAMADSGIAAWESKYFYRLWRPVTGIRAPTSPVRDRTFMPLGAPASNLQGPNFTPPFPAYPSGHAVFGGTLFQTLRRFYGTDMIPFDFVSDEFNGITKDQAGNARARVSRHFSSLSVAEEENGQSRIYLGIHWAFDKTEGIKQGNKVADHVFDNAFRPQ